MKVKNALGAALLLGVLGGAMTSVVVSTVIMAKVDSRLALKEEQDYQDDQAKEDKRRAEWKAARVKNLYNEYKILQGKEYCATRGGVVDEKVFFALEQHITYCGDTTYLVQDLYMEGFGK